MKREEYNEWLKLYRKSHLTIAERGRMYKLVKKLDGRKTMEIKSG